MTRNAMMILLIAGGALLSSGVSAAPKQAQAKPASGESKDERQHAALTVRLPAAACVVTDEAIDPAEYAYFRGRRVYFANETARQAFEVDPYSYAEAVKRQWQTLKPLRMQVRCPMTGKELDLTVYVEGPTHRIYFASEDAKAQWSKLTPARQAKRLERTYSFQTTCAACGNLINPTVMRTYDGHTVFFCCPHCPMALKDDPKPFLKEVRAEEAANRAAFEKRRKQAAVEDDEQETDSPEEESAQRSAAD